MRQPPSRRLPTARRRCARAGSLRGFADGGNGVQRQPAPSNVVVDTAHHQRAAVARGLCAHVGSTHPQRAHDALVERARGDVLARDRRESETQVRLAAVVRCPQVDADEVRELDLPRAFLECFAQGALRETLEESAWQVELTHLIGIYLWTPDDSRKAYLRFAFAAVAREHVATRALDKGIVRALWMSAADMRAQSARHRSPLVMRCVDDYVAGCRLPLDAIAAIGKSTL